MGNRWVGGGEITTAFPTDVNPKAVWHKGQKRKCSMFIREKKTDCGEYREVDIIPRTEEAEKAARGKRGKRRKAKKPKQDALNDKNAKRYLVQLGNGNFHAGDLHTSCTYSADNLPDTVEEAEKVVGNYIRRIAYRRQKLGLDPLKYILVTEYKCTKGGKQLKRIHHHIVMNGGLDRDEVEMMWTAQRVNWRKADSPDKKEAAEYRDSIKKLGWVNADRLQMNENGIEGLCRYIIKDPQGKKRYSSSRNLDRPETKREDNTPEASADKSTWKASRDLIEPQEKCNDFKFSKAKVERLAKSTDGGLSEFREIYKDYNIVSCEPVYYEQTGWHIYLKMWKKKPRAETKAAGKKKRKKAGSRARPTG